MWAVSYDHLRNALISHGELRAACVGLVLRAKPSSSDSRDVISALLAGENIRLLAAGMQQAPRTTMEVARTCLPLPEMFPKAPGKTYKATPHIDNEYPKKASAPVSFRESGKNANDNIVVTIL